jgi:hypothetical protein
VKVPSRLRVALLTERRPVELLQFAAEIVSVPPLIARAVP